MVSVMGLPCLMAVVLTTTPPTTVLTVQVLQEGTSVYDARNLR